METEEDRSASGAVTPMLQVGEGVVRKSGNDGGVRLLWLRMGKSKLLPP